MDSVYRTVKRACYAGLDSVTLRREVATRIASAVAYDAYAFGTTGLYDAPHNSFYPAADGKPFKLTMLTHTQRNIKLEPAPPPDIGKD